MTLIARCSVLPYKDKEMELVLLPATTLSTSKAKFYNKQEFLYKYSVILDAIYNFKCNQQGPQLIYNDPGQPKNSTLPLQKSSYAFKAPQPAIAAAGLVF